MAAFSQCSIVVLERLRVTQVRSLYLWNPKVSYSVRNRAHLGLLPINTCFRCKLFNSTVTFDHVIHRRIKSLKWRLTCSRWDWLNKVDRSILNVRVIYIYIYIYIWSAFPLQWEVPLCYGSCHIGVAPLFVPCGLSLRVGRLNTCYTMQHTYLKYYHLCFIWCIYKRLSYSEQTNVPQGNWWGFEGVCNVASRVVLHYLITFL